MKASIAQVLLVDHQSVIALDIQRLLEPLGVETTVTRSGEQAMKLARQRRFDLIILNIHLPDISGLDVCRRLKQDDSLMDIPVIFLSGEFSPHFMDLTFRLGAVDYLTKPFEAEDFKARVLAHLGLPPKEGENVGPPPAHPVTKMSTQTFMLSKPVPRPLARVLYVEDQPTVAAIVVHELVRAGIDVKTVASGEQCLALVREQPFDLILMDHTLPDMDGLEVCRRLKGDAVLKSIPIILFTTFPNEHDEREARRLGATDYLQKCFHGSQLIVRILAAVKLARSTHASSEMPVQKLTEGTQLPRLSSWKERL